jgi:hypothetical protein
MFQFTDAEYQLDLYHQRAGEWRRAAAADHLAREATADRRHGPRWRWPTRRRQAVCVPAAS